MVIMLIGDAKNEEYTGRKKCMAEKEVNPDENTIYVGNKPPMSYVLAVVTQFNGGSEEVIIKARGRAISRAVDTAEITRNRFVQNAKVKEIKIGTESITNEEGRNSNVSSIEISLTTKK
jgi:DNA-binding protein